VTRIALWGSAGLPNVGDRMISFVVADELRHRLPSAEVDLFCPWVTERSAVRPRPASLRLSADGWWMASERYDAVVVPGGGVLGGPPFAHPVLKSFCLGNDPASFLPSVFTAWHAVGAQDDSPEPASVEERDYLAAVATRLDHCTVRDAAAAGRVGMTGLLTPPIVPDPVFALASLEPGARPTPGRPVVGVSLGAPPVTGPLLAETVAEPSGTELGWGLCRAPEATAAAIARSMASRDRDRSLLARSLLELAAEVELCFIGVRNMYGDAQVAEQLAAALPGTRCELVDVGDHGRLAELYGGCAAVVVSRYHSAVLALRAGTPVVGADTSATSGPSKLRDLLSRLGCAEHYWTAATTSSLADIATAVVGDPHAAETAKQRYAAMHSQAGASLDGLAASISMSVGAGSESARR
jgi:polysaccharide pyruvyl transferase WcaK-like protein